MKIKKDLIIIVLTFMFTYLFMSFMAWDCNPKTWGEFGRVIFIFWSVGFSGLFILVSYVNK